MDSVAASPDVRGLVEQVMSGALFSGLLLDDAHERASAVEALIGRVVDEDTRLVWVGNPLRSPLTIERFLIQIVGPEIDLRVERSAADLASVIAAPVGRETRLLIVVQQPETINVETLHLLIQMGWYLGNEAVHVQFLFAGSTSFVVPRLAEPRTMALSWPSETPAIIEAPQTASRRCDVLPLLLLLLVVTLGAMVAMAPVSQDGMPDLGSSSPPARSPPGAPLPKSASTALHRPQPQLFIPSGRCDRN